MHNSETDLFSDEDNDDGDVTEEAEDDQECVESGDEVCCEITDTGTNISEICDTGVSETEGAHIGHGDGEATTVLM